MTNNWQGVQLGNIVSIRTGHKDANAQSANGMYPFFTCAQDISRIDSYTFDCEAVLVAGNGDFNVKYYKGKFDAYQRTYVFEGKDSIKNKFLYYLLQNYLPEVTSNARGSTIQYLKINDFIDFKFNLPDISIQDKVINILNTLSETIQKTDQIIQKSEELKNGLMYALLTKGIGHKKFKKTKLGEIPEEWELVTIGDVAKITNGQVDPKKDPYTSMVLIAPNHIESNSGRILERVTAYDQQAISGKYLVKSGDVIYSKIRPYLKKVTIADLDCLCSADMYPIKGSEKLDSRFLFHILLSDNFTNYANENSGRTGIPKINRGELNGYLFALPSIPEQKQIASMLSSVDKDISNNQELKTKYIFIKNGLMQDIFSQKVQII